MCIRDRTYTEPIPSKNGKLSTKYPCRIYGHFSQRTGRTDLLCAEYRCKDAVDHHVERVQQSAAAVHEHEVDLVTDVVSRDRSRRVRTQEVQTHARQRLHTQ